MLPSYTLTKINVSITNVLAFALSKTYMDSLYLIDSKAFDYCGLEDFTLQIQTFPLSLYSLCRDIVEIQGGCESGLIIMQKCAVQLIILHAFFNQQLDYVVQIKGAIQDY